MLYVSTRSRTDSYTPFRALCEAHAPDGGMFVPMNLPVFSRDEICGLRENNFGQNVASILNKFFSANLNGWDVEFCIGRYPFKLISMNHRLVVAELWHNLDERYEYIVSGLFRKLKGDAAPQAVPTEWARTAIGISVLFGLYGELLRLNLPCKDIAVNADDHTVPLAAWYARRMGLPIGTIICGCGENSTFWDMLHRGELSTVQAARAKETDGIERLIYSAFGLDETLRYVGICQKRGVYHLDEEALSKLNNGLYAAVVSNKRVSGVLSNIYRTNDYVTEPHMALVYGGLQDYRARSGESRQTLVLSMQSPVLETEKISGIVGLSAEDIKKRIHNP